MNSVARLIVLASTFIGVSMSQAASIPVYFGTQSTPPLTGIALAHLDTRTGQLTTPTLVAQTPDPAFLVVHPDGKTLYICNTQTPGGLSAFAIQPSGALSFLNHKVATGRGPSHVSIDRSGRYVFDANYGGGYVEVYSRKADGSLLERTAFVQHTGSSIHPERQTKPYAHWFSATPDDRFALAADLGTDHVMVYRFDDRTGTLQAGDPAFIAVTPGAGPRHIAWHPNGRQFYLIQELANAVTLYSWDAAAGTATAQQTVPTLPADFSGASTAAEIAVHPNGRFLYASNRGHDSIALFALDAAGRMTPKGHTSSQGKVPRYFVIDPTAHWMIVANQGSDNVAVFAVSPETGELTASGVPITLAKPGGIGFVRP
ncbi:MAG TPA: lactonase family protein [Povalibacter sp.]|nr:lactonase family protein [Povalibacter sp.]